MSLTLSRRTFLGAAGAGFVFVVGFRCADGSVHNLSGPSRAKKSVRANVYIAIDSDGIVTLTISKPDMGQGPRTSLAMILAEELGVAWDHIVVEQADGDGDKYGPQGVGGSGTIRALYEPLRMASATAASMLCHAAASKWSCEASACSLEGGKAVNRTLGKSIAIGDLVELASTMPTPQDSSIKPRPVSEYQIIGKPTRRVDNAAVVTGKAKFGLDTRVPGMKVAVVVRPRAFGATVKSFDDSACKKLAGYVTAFPISSGVAVVGDNTWAAMKAAEALNVQFDDGPNASLDSAEITRRLKAAVVAFPEIPSGAGRIVEATYEFPFLSHATMEPQNCTAVVANGKCEVWVPTQQPEGARRTAAGASGVGDENTTVHVTLVGGGFGRRLSTEYVAECVAIAKQLGKPVQLVWTRTDDMQHDHYRPVTYHAMKGAVGANGNPALMYHQLVEPGGRRRGNGQPEWGDVGSLYGVAAKRIGLSIANPVPTGAWRSVENTYMSFVQECFFDELCAAAGTDPMKARIAMTGNDRLKALLERAQEISGWGKPMAAKMGRGVACFNGYGSMITQVAEVDCSGSAPKVTKMFAVVDCGLAINPLGVEAQIQGAMMDAVSTTLHAAITIGGGGVVEDNWNGFQWGRMVDAPHMVVEIIGKSETPGGMGEVGYPAAGPAIANAIMAATGKRIRKLPVKTEELV